eukprot:NP_491584.1 Uncharacterized protein CELE_C24A11.6 [Caenorhabditis elegans]
MTVMIYQMKKIRSIIILKIPSVGNMYKFPLNNLTQQKIIIIKNLKCFDFLKFPKVSEYLGIIL